MKENRFFAAKADIGRLCEDKGVDVGVATAMYIADHCMKDYGDELATWNEAIIEHQTSEDKTLADLFKE